MDRRSARRPISCRLCRQRKLRCSRQVPCSNCTGRGLACQYDGDKTELSTKASGNPGNTMGTSPEPTREELLARVEKLEALLATKTTQTEVTSDSSPGEPLLPGETASTSSLMSLQLQRLANDMVLMERSCSGQLFLVRTTYCLFYIIFRHFTDLSTT